MTTERYWIDHCIGIARDAGNVDAAQDATKELEALRSALTDAQEIARRGDDIILELEKKLDAARSSLTASGEALREYGHHKNSCRFISNVPNPGIRPGSCTCGLEVAMRRANG